ncbi:MAG TPA: carbon starvation protein A [Desulfurococcales archaeon]|nr:carbon starvation protein A [Desulfurococcales archaeon]
MAATTLVILIGVVIYVIFYLTHGKYLEKYVAKADPSRETPAKRLYDGVDYVPANKYVLYGHHFASIAGAGPIVGPALALAWGWLPTLIWIWFGNVFIGVVHDYLAIMSSVRYDGRSIAWISGKLMSKRAFYAFNAYIWFALLLVVAVFLVVVTALFTYIPGTATASLLFIAIAIITGYIMYRTPLGFRGGTVIGIILLILAIIAGINFPLNLGYSYWVIILAIYCIVAASIPVWVLLQPRDYLNAYILWASLAIGGITAIVAFKGMEAPLVTSLTNAIVVGGKPSPIWPTIPLVVACGALSGFHSLVGSGTTSKQLANETHGLLVGYAGMLSEGFLSTMIIAILGGFGLTALINAGVEESAVKALTDPATFAAKWVSVIKGAKWFVVIPHSYATATNTAFGLPYNAMLVFSALWISAFALTSLDTATRLGRFAWQELMEPLREKTPGLYTVLSNRWFASIILVVIGAALALSKLWTVLWPAFAGMNQLLASLALMTIALWAIKVQKTTPLGKGLTLTPALFLWITVTLALIWFEIMVIPPLIAAGGLKTATGIAVGVITIIGLALNIMLLVDFITAYRRPT